MKIKKRLRYLAIILFILAIAGFTGFHILSPKLILERSAVPNKPSVADLGLPYEDAQIMSKDSLKLKGTLFQAQPGVISDRGILVFVHGIGAYKEAYLNEVLTYTTLGYDCFIYDQRAHGQSGGRYCTYGFYEKQDLLDVINYLKDMGYQESIGLWGRSLGGAVVLQTLPLTADVGYAIVESTFGDLRTIVYDYQRLWLGINFKWLGDYALNRAEKIAFFEADSVRPATSALKVDQPVLLIHGTNDQRISIDYGKEIYENLASRSKQFIPVKNAGHLDVASVGGPRLQRQIMDFINWNDGLKAP